jgi:hypothetical protein
MNELDNDVVIIKINTSIQSTSVSLTTVIRHFLGQSLNYFSFFVTKNLFDNLRYFIINNL